MDRNSEYGRIYSEICRGFSFRIVEDITVYFKHPTFAEHFSTYTNYDIFLNEGKKKGLESEAEKIKNAIDGGWWSKDIESKIDFLKLTVKNLQKTRDKLILPSQKAEIEKQIKQNQAILASYSKDRGEIIGYTLENYAHSKFLEELLIFFTYKNKDFTEKLFTTREEYYNLTEDYLYKIKNAFDQYSEIFNDNNIKEIAACGFFQNLVYLTDDPYGFWGKSATECTKYQINLILYGKMYKNIIKNHAENGKPILDDILNDPEKFVAFIDSQSGGNNHKIKTRKRNSDNSVYSYVGATNEDLNKLGVKVEKIKGKSLLSLAQEKGGILEKSDYFAARENN